MASMLPRLARWFSILAVVLVGGLAVGAVPATGQTPTAPAPNAAVGTARGDLRFIVVTHGQASDPYWSVVQNGVNQAAEDMGVEVDYQAPRTFDMVQMAELIDAAVASEPDGIALSIPDADALGDSIRAGVAAGIPMISLDSGSDVAEELGMLTHVGQTEYEAGVGAGQRMGAAGISNALCVNQEVGNVALDDRCRGFTDGLAESGGAVEVLQVDLNNPTEAQSRIEAALTADESLGGILTLGPTGAAPALEALRASGSTVPLATFDLSPDVLEGIEAGDILFAIDSQQYLQGYLPIVMLTLYNENLNTIANPVLMTGPGFVTSDNAAQVIDLAAQGTR
jgi:simple sugar transport system substrate-binding protein